MNKRIFNSYFKDFNFKELFNEMGWDNFRGDNPKIPIDDTIYEVEGIVHKRNFVIASICCENIPTKPRRVIRRLVLNSCAPFWVGSSSTRASGSRITIFPCSSTSKGVIRSLMIFGRRAI